LFPGNISDLADKIKSQGKEIVQGYLPQSLLEDVCRNAGITPEFNPLEIRVRSKGEKYFLTLKGNGTSTRDEQEVTIDKKVFDMYLPHAIASIRKTRMEVPYRGLTAEVDAYHDRDLITAEIEVHSPDKLNEIQSLGLDVTSDKAYKNKNLARR